MECRTKCVRNCIAILCILALLPVPTVAECAYGWNKIDTMCYLFSRDYLNWFNAQSSCRAHSARLAETEDRTHTDHLRNLAYSKAAGTSMSSFWIGGRDDVLEGQWLWSTSEHTITYAPWWPGNPDNVHGNEHCLEVLCERGACNYNDDVCTKSNRYICERPIDWEPYNFG